MMQRRKIALLLAGVVLSVTAGIAIRLFAVRYGEEVKFRIYSSEFRRLTIADPLFWDPSLDPDTLESAVKKLRGVERNLSQESAFFWPISFVAILPEVGRATKNFIDAPTHENAKKLLAKYDSAALLYESETEKLKNAVDKFRQNVGGDETELEKNLPILKKNAEALRAETERRKECARTGNCKMAFPALPEFPPEPKEYPERLPDSLGLLFYEKETSVLGAVRVPSECWTDGVWRELYAIETRPSPTESFIRVKRADNHIYLVIENSRDLEARLSAGGVNKIAAELQKPWVEAGLAIRHIGSGGFQRCSDLTHYPKTLTLLWLVGRLKADQPISSHLDEGKLPKDAKPFARLAIETERELINSETPSWSSAVKLMSSIRQILELHDKNSITLSDKAFTELSAIQSAISSELPLFDRVLEAFANDLSSSLAPFWKGEAIPDRWSRAEFHNYLSIMYLPFSQSVWRIQETPVFSRKLGGDMKPINADSIEALRENYGFRLVFLSQIRHLFMESELIEITRKSLELTSKLSL